MLYAMNRRLFPVIAFAALVSTTRLPAQASQQLNWDVISVKPMSPDSCKPAEGGVRSLPNGFSAACVPAVFVLEFAYHLMDPARILGLPKWAIGPQMYAIEARVSADDVAAYAKLKPSERAAMMQIVLADRFGMKAHMETREMPAYALVVARNGPKLKVSSSVATSGSSQFGGGGGEVKWVNSPLTNLKFLLAKETGRPVVDQTGLTGKYDFTLEYTPAAEPATGEGGRPSIFTALEDQLGLKLLPSKQPVDVLVVDRIDQPTAN